jgi:hypothetical protein
MYSGGCAEDRLPAAIIFEPFRTRIASFCRVHDGSIWCCAVVWDQVAMAGLVSPNLVTCSKAWPSCNTPRSS